MPVHKLVLIDIFTVYIQSNESTLCWTEHVVYGNDGLRTMLHFNKCRCRRPRRRRSRRHHENGKYGFVRFFAHHVRTTWNCIRKKEHIKGHNQQHGRAVPRNVIIALSVIVIGLAKNVTTKNAPPPREWNGWRDWRVIVKRWWRWYAFFHRAKL